MWNFPVYYGEKYWYSFFFCEKCQKFTTHRTIAPQGPGTFDLFLLKWECLECITTEVTKKEKDVVFLPCQYCGYEGGPL